MGVSPSTTGVKFAIAADVERAIREGGPVVALESAVITHGLPFPQNLDVALRMQQEVAVSGSIPATVAVIGGEIRVGVSDSEIRALAQDQDGLKVGMRDFASAARMRASGGTTVAASIFAAQRAGITVFATGGIGGVHRGNTFDVSADLLALARTRIMVVCAGAKAILDLAATLEVLESLGVPILGYGTENFPAFYSPGSGLHVSARADTPLAVAEYWAQHDSLGLESAVLVANPIPQPDAIGEVELEGWIEVASAEARAHDVRGKALTPFLLRRIGELSGGRTIKANISLLLNNARLAGKIAATLPNSIRQKERSQP